MPYDLIVRQGRVVTPRGIVEADIGIRGEKIVAVRKGLSATPNTRIVDAAGHFVLPGAIDVHVHLELDVGVTQTADDWRTGTRAAARGGVTMVIDFTNPVPKGDGTHESLSQSIDNWLAKAEPKALIDYSFHLGVTNWRQHAREIPGLIKRGFPTFKEYMIYASRELQSDDAAIFGTLEQMRDNGGMLLVHAESPLVLDFLIERYHTKEQMKKHGAWLHVLSRPNFVEEDAVQRCLKWCEATRGPLYIVHMSTGGAADMVQAAQSRGVPVLAETCAQYLVLDESVYKRPDGHLFGHCPQVKSKKDQRRLWQGVADGTLSVISTDTCSFNRKQKGLWKGDWTRIPYGLPGLETLLPLVYTHGVMKKKLSLEEMVMRLSTNPARAMGMYPRKGVIASGSDADLAIIHPSKRMRVDPAAMETNVDWSPYEGWNLAGFARTTISRGEVIVDDYRVVGNAGRGKWIRRENPGCL